MSITSCLWSKPVIKKNSLKQRLQRIKSILFPPIKVTPISSQIIVKRGIHIPMRDGSYLSANIYLPKKTGKFPILMSLHPYCKDNLPKNGHKLISYRLIRQTSLVQFSEETGWEAPDPDFWVGQDYVVINVDKRGFGKSPGEQEFFDDNEARDYYDAIEWVASQSWSNGKVGLFGVSYLAISQYKAAALQPPHLAAICPWEGFTDAYKDAFYPGGVREDGFVKVWSRAVKKSFGLNFRNEQLTHKLHDEFYLSMIADLKKIEIPALICGSFSDHLLHSRGSFRAFDQISSKYKWLYTHRSGKWATFYSEDAKNFQLKFFDYFLKNIDNQFIKTPPVRLEVREDRSKIHKIYNLNEWPLANTNWTKLYLNPSTTKLQLEVNSDNQNIIFNPATQSLRFDYQFDKDTEICGPMKLELFLKVDNPSTNIFAGIQKFNGCQEINFEGSYGFANDIVSIGFMKVSLYKTNPNTSKYYYPEHDFQNFAPITKDEIIKLEISLLPSATLFRKNEVLRLVIQGRSFLSSFKLDQIGAHEPSPNSKCTLYTGSEFPSLLLIPMIE